MWFSLSCKILPINLQELGMSAVIAVVGRQGVGKSRLVSCMVANGAQQEVFVDTDSSQAMKERLKQIISIGEQRDGVTVVEIPGYISIEVWYNLNWGAVVVVDCPDQVQQRYMHSNEVQNKHSREAYTQVATDVFLNTVDTSHINWVAKQLLRSYAIL